MAEAQKKNYVTTQVEITPKNVMFQTQVPTPVDSYTPNTFQKPNAIDEVVVFTHSILRNSFPVGSLQTRIVKSSKQKAVVSIKTINQNNYHDEHDTIKNPEIKTAMRETRNNSSVSMSHSIEHKHTPCIQLNPTVHTFKRRNASNSSYNLTIQRAQEIKTPKTEIYFSQLNGDPICTNKTNEYRRIISEQMDQKSHKKIVLSEDSPSSKYLLNGAKGETQFQDRFIPGFKMPIQSIGSDRNRQPKSKTYLYIGGKQMHHKTGTEKQKTNTFQAKSKQQSSSQPQNLSLVITSKPLNKQDKKFKAKEKIFVLDYSASAQSALVVKQITDAQIQPPFVQMDTTQAESNLKFPESAISPCSSDKIDPKSWQSLYLNNSHKDLAKSRSTLQNCSKFVRDSYQSQNKQQTIMSHKAHLRISIVEMSGNSFEQIGGYSKGSQQQQNQTTLIPCQQAPLFENQKLLPSTQVVEIFNPPERQSNQTFLTQNQETHRSDTLAIQLLEQPQAIEQQPHEFAVPTQYMSAENGRRMKINTVQNQKLIFHPKHRMYRIFDTGTSLQASNQNEGTIELSPSQIAKNGKFDQILKRKQASRNKFMSQTKVNVRLQTSVNRNTDLEYKPKYNFVSKNDVAIKVQQYDYSQDRLGTAMQSSLPESQMTHYISQREEQQEHQAQRRPVTARKQRNPLLADERIRKMFDESKYNTRNTIYGDERHLDDSTKLKETKHTKSEKPVKALLQDTQDISDQLNASKPQWMSFDNPDRYTSNQLTEQAQALIVPGHTNFVFGIQI